MNPIESEQTVTSLRFAGDWAPGWSIGLAAVLAIMAWLLYYRESRQRPGMLSWFLPTLRAIAIFLVALILTGPVLHHEKTVRQLGRLFVLVDGSGSMALDDRGMAPGRKAGLLTAAGKLDGLPILSAYADAEEQFEVIAAAGIEREFADQEEFDPVGDSFLAATGAIRPALKQLCSLSLPEGDLRERGSKLIKEAERDVFPQIDAFHKEFAKDRNYKSRSGWMRDIARRIEKLQPEATAISEDYVTWLRSPSAGETGNQYREAVAAFDGSTRWDRLEEILFGDKKDDPGPAEAEAGADSADPPDRAESTGDGLLAKLAGEQDIELVILGEGAPELAWWQRRAGSRSSGDMPKKFLHVPDARFTDLASGLERSLGGKDALAEGSAAVLLTDGRHNGSGSPESVAGAFGRTGIPLFTVGFGALRPPEDIILAKVNSAESVFVEDRVYGEAILDDHMMPGRPYKMTVMSGEEVVWEQDFQTDGNGERRIAFDFPLKPLVGEDAEVKGRNLPVALEVAITAQGAQPQAGEPGAEILTDNNTKPLLVQAVTRRRKVLILDGRPRWETRYLKNLFDRDEQWETTVMQGPVDPADGTRPDGILPEDREGWLGFDIIVIGDLPARGLTKDERSWVAEFVEKRGGGLVFVDGKRRHLERMSRTEELGHLLPVVYTEEDGDILPEGLRPAPDALGLGALTLAPGEPDAEVETWANLQPPRWLAQVNPNPAAEVLVEAALPDADPIPAVVTQRYGAGRVLYVATDELWRWRYREGDTFHRRFWMQMANWIGEPPFAATGKQLSVASDRLTYEDGEAAQLRVRLRDEEGGPLEGAKPVAEVRLDGENFAEIELQEDPSGGGLYRATTSPLPGGEFTVSVREPAIEDEGVELTFRVEDPPNQELDSLSLDRGLLTSMASASAAGKFLLEEEAGQLPGLLRSMDRKEVITSETLLWASWWWFVPVIIVLTLEWILRKRGGFV